jgi:hypothetical protein
VVGAAEKILLFLSEIEGLKHFLRGFDQSPAQVRVERRSDEQLIDAGFQAGRCGIRHAEALIG